MMGMPSSAPVPSPPSWNDDAGLAVAPRRLVEDQRRVANCAFSIVRLNVAEPMSMSRSVAPVKVAVLLAGHQRHLVISIGVPSFSSSGIM
jgi:hypothetical protein